MRNKAIVAYTLILLIAVFKISVVYRYTHRDLELKPPIMARGLRIRQHPHWKVMSGNKMWRSKRNLTYSISSMAESTLLSSNYIRFSIASAFASWAAVIALHFLETDNYQGADIKIEFVSGDHGDGFPFDGKLGILSHAFAPEDGRFHLDSDEMWTVDMSHTNDECGIDLETVALHEIGHLIGLDHSNVIGTVMFPTIEARVVRRSLTPDDIEGARYLYGPYNYYNNLPRYESHYSAASLANTVAHPFFCVLLLFILSSV